MKIPKLENPYPNCHIITVNSRIYYYSYDTLIGYENLESELKIRNGKFFSNTTTKHINKFNIANFTKIQSNIFYKIVEADCL